MKQDEYGHDIVESTGEPAPYTRHCAKLKKQVTLGYYQQYCECGDPIIGVPRRPEYAF